MFLLNFEDKAGLVVPVSSEVVQAALHHELSSSSVLSGSQQLLLPLLFAPVSALFAERIVEQL